MLKNGPDYKEQIYIGVQLRKNNFLSETHFSYNIKGFFLNPKMINYGNKKELCLDFFLNSLTKHTVQQGCITQGLDKWTRTTSV